jgi:hypothetical protein
MKKSVTLSLDFDLWVAYQKHCLDYQTKPSREIAKFIRQKLGLAQPKPRKRGLSQEQEATLLAKKILEENSKFDFLAEPGEDC